MGKKQQFEGVRAREASIFIDFRWNRERFREHLKLAPTAPNMRAAARMRNEIMAAIEIGKFDWSDFAKYFPDSPSLPKGGGVGAQPTLGEVAETWLTLTEPNVAVTTIREYRNALNRYWLPLFCDRPIASIGYEELAIYVASLPLKAAKTFNNVMTPLRGLFAYALKTKKIPQDITQDIDSRKGQKANPDPLDLEEVEIVLSHVLSKYGPEWHNYFEIAFFAGLRPSEEIALQWTTVDFRREQIRVEAARVRAIDKDTKTHHARDIDMSSRAMAALVRQKTHTFLTGGFVFRNPQTGGRLMDTAAALTVWRPTLKALGIRYRSAKQTRHTYATLCLRAGMNPAYVARQMGHVNAKMFFEVYAKWIDGAANDLEKRKMDALLGGGPARQSVAA